jgi:5-methylcytosine-specific restriction enzyme A
MTKHRFTKAEREAIFFSARGICHLCNQPILPGQDWDCSHVDIPEQHGGDEVAPAHRRCHRIETSEVTQPLIAKVRNVRQRHIGAFQSRTPLPCGRNSSRSKGFDGKVKPRVRGAEHEAVLRASSPFLNHGAPPMMRQIVEEDSQP